MSTAQQIRAALEPGLAPLGFVVEDITVTPAGKRRLVRVLVDTDITALDTADESTPIPPLSLDAVAEATRAVDDVLEQGDLMGSAPYVLEVSSPGVGRPLTTREHFRRNVGRLVEVRHADGTETGRLVRVGVDDLTLEVPATKKVPGHVISLGFDAAPHGTVQVEFTRAAEDTTDLDAEAFDPEEES